MYVTLNNVRLSGQGDRTLMFAHGFGCSSAMWRHVTPAFEVTNPILLFDHVGAGRSDLSAYSREKYASLQGYADDVLGILDELRIARTVFVGHSVGAMIGVLAANAAPGRFEALVLVGPSPRYINDGDYIGGFEAEAIEELLELLDVNPLGWAAQMAPVIVGNADRPEHADELADSLCKTDPAIARHFARVTFTSDNRGDLARVQVPTLILQCRDDLIAPASVGRFVHGQIAGSRLVMLDATGHCPHMTAPHEVAAAIRSLLDTL